MYSLNINEGPYGFFRGPPHLFFFVQIPQRGWKGGSRSKSSLPSEMLDKALAHLVFVVLDQDRRDCKIRNISAGVLNSIQMPLELIWVKQEI